MNVCCWHLELIGANRRRVAGMRRGEVGITYGNEVERIKLGVLSR
jgi:hypothetical protein